MQIQRVEGRTDPATVPVRVYRCLTESKPTWSIVATEGVDRDKVIGYADEVVLTACEFVVKRATWRNIIDGKAKRGRKRNVVAWVVGKIADADQVMTDPARVEFNFYPEFAPAGAPVGEFYRVDSNEFVHSADAVRFTAEVGSDGKKHGRTFV